MQEGSVLLYVLSKGDVEGTQSDMREPRARKLKSAAESGACLTVCLRHSQSCLRNSLSSERPCPLKFSSGIAKPFPANVICRRSYHQRITLDVLDIKVRPILDISSPIY